MTTSLGIAGVTAVLQNILSNRFAAGVPSVGGNIAVTTVAPDRVDLSSATDPNQVNIFLHQVMPNPGWNNVGLPARDGGARRVGAPPLVIDLHYLISIYGSAALTPEILLGEVMQEFHERPVPTREIIASALNPAVPPTGFPAELANSGLADQIENIRITPESISNEEISKLWTALQAHYRMSIAYQVTTVIIESELPARTALPVSRPLSYAFSASFPVIDSVQAVDGAGSPIVAGTALRIRGSQLEAPGLAVLFDEVDLGSAVTARAPEHIDLTLPEPLPAGLFAGAVSVQVVRSDTISEPPELRRSVASNPAVVVLRPGFTATVNVDAAQDEVVDGVTLRSGVIDLTLSPPVRRSQRVRVALNQTSGDLRAYTFRAPDGHGIPVDAPPGSDQTAAVAVPFAGVAAGSYLIRVQVDAGESVLTRDADGVYDGPEVSI